MEIKVLQSEVDIWIKQYGVRYFSELTNLAVLMEEVGEFSSLLARKYGEQSFKKNVDQDDVDKQISDELADILFVLVCLANQMDIDLEAALKKNLEKKTKRDSQRHLINKKLKS